MAAIKAAVDARGYWRGTLPPGIGRFLKEHRIDNFLGDHRVFVEGGEVLLCRETTRLKHINAVVEQTGVWEGQLPPGCAAALRKLALEAVGATARQVDAGGWFEIRRHGHFAVVRSPRIRAGECYDRHALQMPQLSDLFDRRPVLKAEERRGFKVLVPFAASGVRVW